MELFRIDSLNVWGKTLVKWRRGHNVVMFHGFCCHLCLWQHLRSRQRAIASAAAAWENLSGIQWNSSSVCCCCSFVINIAFFTGLRGFCNEFAEQGEDTFTGVVRRRFYSWKLPPDTTWLFLKPFFCSICCSDTSSSTCTDNMCANKCFFLRYFSGLYWVELCIWGMYIS